MQLTNDFTVNCPIEQAWDVLLDLERIAPCMPGAELRGRNGDEYLGVVKVKVGPITAEYEGRAVFCERDDTSYRAVLKAEGRDVRGQGNASALVTATLAPNDTGTEVRVVTELNVSGRVAQFGRGVMGDVSTKLLGHFVESLERQIVAPPAPPRDELKVVEDGPATTESATAPVDLLEMAGGSVAKRVVPAVVGMLLVLLLWSRRRGVSR